MAAPAAAVAPAAAAAAAAACAAPTSHGKSSHLPPVVTPASTQFSQSPEFGSVSAQLPKPSVPYASVAAMPAAWHVASHIVGDAPTIS